MKRQDSESLTYFILPTSSNLLGICFFILSYIKVGDKAKSTLLDECIILPIILFFIASVLSYLSMRSAKDRPKMERMADFIFMIGLLSMSFIAIILVLEFI